MPPGAADRTRESTGRSRAAPGTVLSGCWEPRFAALLARDGHPLARRLAHLQPGLPRERALSLRHGDSGSTSGRT